ncbi:organic solvent tolerance protein [Escherichia coli]|uniref:Organic solvent tolerance protein n=1 Tax=Escherichia coli TaxID=562 RepID=A0A377E2F7_ECOLX|nr:organic solvent tolerance protein [Escherichia coli]
MWENEFRYLSQAGAGLMELDYLPSDKVYEDEHPNDDSSRRWLFYWNHSGVMDQVWRFNVDYTKVSDPSYFNDFDNKYGSSTDGYATQKIQRWLCGAKLQCHRFNQAVPGFSSEQNTSSYSAEPQLDVNYYQNDVGPFDTRIYGQAVHFVNTRDDMPEATRVHLEPTINLPLSNNWGSINTEAKLLATHYQQTNLDWYNSRNTTKLDESVNRVMPQFKVDGKMVFERDMEMLAPGYTQTLEPRAQYLYVPYRDQSDIYNYDSSLLQSDYSGLFRDRTYGGLDRIASANQVTTGVTSRIYDDAAVERFNISVGQIYYFTESRTGDDNITWENDDKTGSLVWAGDTYWRISERWGLRGGIQYDTRLDNVATSNSSIEYRRDEDRLVQLNYRYASPEYIQATLPKYYSTAEQYKNGISQVGAVASWPIADRWSIVGAYYYDTNANKQADSMLGVQYSSCCYAIRVGYERKLNGWDNDKQHAVYDNAIGFNIELRGLSSNYGLGTQEMLRSNILPYQNTL